MTARNDLACFDAVEDNSVGVLLWRLAVECRQYANVLAAQDGNRMNADRWHNIAMHIETCHRNVVLITGETTPLRDTSPTRLPVKR